MISPPNTRIKLTQDEHNPSLYLVKALISHMMDPGRCGQAADNAGQRKILHTFTCSLDGKVVFRARLEPAISANPYLEFYVRAESAGTLKLTWLGDDGSVITAEERILTG